RLEPKLRAGLSALEPSRPGHQLSLGRQLSFNVETTSGDGCSNPQPREGVIRAIGERAVAVADGSNPAGGYTDADYQEFVDFFDSEVWPLVTGTFGIPSDIDDNGRV